MNLLCNYVFLLQVQSICVQLSFSQLARDVVSNVPTDLPSHNLPASTGCCLYCSTVCQHPMVPSEFLLDNDEVIQSVK